MEYEENLIVAASPGWARRVFPYLRSLGQLALAAGLLALLLWRVDLGSVRGELRQASLWWLAPAFALNLASDWFRAIRWQVLFRPLARVDTPFLFATAVLGVACNLALPLRAGEVVRVQVLRQRTGLSASSIVATLVAEKLSDVVAFSAFIAVGILIYGEARFLWPLALAYAILLAAGLIAFRRLAARAEMEVDGGEQPQGRARRWIASQRRDFGRGLQAFRRPRALAVVGWASLAAWLCEAGMYYACGQALGLDLSPAVYLLVVVVATIAVSVPITQAGLGVFELAVSGLLVAFGVSAERAAAFAVFSHVMVALPYFATAPLAAVALRLSPGDILFPRGAKEGSESEA